VTTVYKLRIQLADDEWGSPLMEAVATSALRDPAHADKQPLVVVVHEHGGWWLAFTMLGGEAAIVYTANDVAVFRGAARKFRHRADTATWVYLPPINRNLIAQKKEEAA
jgi:hypothetical protein